MPVVSATATAVKDLIYDVGLHRGEDTAFYLAKGYRVVAFEANPALVRHCQMRFAEEIDGGRLTIVSGAVTDSTEPTVRFYQHPNSVWGTTNDAWALGRNDAAAPSSEVEVPAVNFAKHLQATGVPTYLKIDIEGADTLCLTTLHDFDARPDNVSIESEQRSWPALLGELDLLQALGYDQFAVVQQATIPGSQIKTHRIDDTPLTFQFGADASGGFGAEIAPWVDRQRAIALYRSVFRRYLLFGGDSVLRKSRLGRGLRGQAQKHLGVPLPGWYDTHARRSTAH
jgi:FkbM family methyltransferase